MTGFVLLLGLIAAPTPAAKDPWVEGERLEFALHDLNGKPVDGSDSRFDGKVVLVDLWGTWCPPCLSEIPTFIELERRYVGRGLIVVAIAFEDLENPDERRRYLREFVTEQGINYLVLDGGRPDDFETALPSVKGVRGLPVEILIDRAGRIRETRNSYGYKKKWVKALTRDIEELLAEPAP